MLQGCFNPTPGRTARVDTTLNGTVETVTWAQGLPQGRVSERGPAKAWGSANEEQRLGEAGSTLCRDRLWGSVGIPRIMHLWATPNLLGSHLLPPPPARPRHPAGAPAGRAGGGEEQKANSSPWTPDRMWSTRQSGEEDINPSVWTPVTHPETPDTLVPLSEPQFPCLQVLTHSPREGAVRNKMR